MYAHRIRRGRFYSNAPHTVNENAGPFQARRR